MNEKLAGSADYARNLVELPSGRFTTGVARFRLDSSFSTRMFLNAFVQYNRAARTWLTNVRYRFIYRPLSDFFVVYNETRPVGLKAQRTLALKYTILMSF